MARAEALRSNQQLFTEAIGERLAAHQISHLTPQNDADRVEALQSSLTRAETDGTRVGLKARNASRRITTRFNEVFKQLSPDERISVGTNLAVLVAQRNMDNGRLG